MESLVSVIIPTFNRAFQLKRAVESVLSQDYQPIQLIVVDDGSTDKTRQVVSSYEKIHYVYQPNTGVSAARNKGIDISAGAYICFLDSDDAWLPGKITAQVALLKARPKYLLCHTNEIWIRRGIRVNPCKRHEKATGDIFDRCLNLCLISPSSVMVRRRLFEEVGLFDENLEACEDYDLWLRVTSRFPVLYIATPLIVKYGGHVDQLSRKYPNMDIFRVYAIEKLIRQGDLDAEQIKAARLIRRKKCQILANGCFKRDRFLEGLDYLTLIET